MTLGHTPHEGLVIGDCLPHEPIQSMIKMSLFPIGLVECRNRCGLTADFAAIFLSGCSPDRKTPQGRLPTNLNERIKDAVKYSALKATAMEIRIFESRAIS
jgi:hypothetical protein